MNNEKNKPWMKYWSEEAKNMEEPQESVFEYWYNNNKQHPYNIAIEYYDNKITTDKTEQEVYKWVKAFTNAGIKENDQISLLMFGTPEFAYIILALSYIGASANMIPSDFNPEEIQTLINESDSKLLIVQDIFISNVKDIVNNTCINNAIVVPFSRSFNNSRFYKNMEKNKYILLSKIISSKIKNNEIYLNVDEFLNNSKDLELPNIRTYKKNTPIMTVYSSGSTGKPKGIVLKNESLVTMAHMHRLSGMNFPVGNRNLHLIPAWFSTGANNNFFLPLLLGVTVVSDPMAIIDKHKFAWDLKHLNINYTIVASASWKYVLSKKQEKYFEGVDLSSLVYPICGGDALPIHFEKEINDFIAAHNGKCKIGKGYGSSENGACLTVTNEQINELGSVGIPLPLVEIGIYDEIDKRIITTPNVRGEIYAKTPCGMLGYYKNEEATKEYYYIDENSDKWSKTGDIGYLTESGSLHCLGRAKDKIENQDLYLFDIEKIVLDHKEVKECKALRVTIDEEEVTVVNIILNEQYRNNKKEILSKIQEECNAIYGNLAPAAYRFKDKFKVLPSNKLDKDSLINDKKGYVLIKDNKFVKIKSQNKTKVKTINKKY